MEGKEETGKKMEYLQSKQDGGEKCRYVRHRSIFSCSELQLHISIEISLKIISKPQKKEFTEDTYI